ncbi:uncharacterized protein LOC144103567 [Amblyomma americanum]
MQSFRELTGLEPHDVLTEEDLVLVKKRKPWSLLEPLPDGIRVHRSGPFLRLSRDTLVAGHQAGQLRVTDVEVAVFAGCPRFGCSQRFREAAAALCAGADTIAVVHNLNAMTDLLALFPRVGTLHLMHDLVAHGARNEDDKAPNRREEQADGDKKEEMAPSPGHDNSALRSLYGDCCALGLNHLFVDTEAAGSLVADFAQLTELETNLEQMVCMSLPQEASNSKQGLGDCGAQRQWSSLVLGSSLHSRQHLILYAIQI